MLKLNELKKGEKAIIKDINCHSFVKTRILDMGFNKNEIVQCLLISPSRTIRAYLIKNTLIALRDNDAQNIMVEVENENSFNR